MRAPGPDKANERRMNRQNLGLGVLEEKKDGDTSESEEVEEEEEAEDDNEEEDHDILLKLLNSSKRHGKGPRGKPSIEVVEHSQDTPTPEKQAAHHHDHTGTEGK